jgi:uncharacterized protein YkwD
VKALGALVCAVLLACGPSGETATVHSAVNDYRVSVGLSALPWSANLGGDAQVWANHLAASGSLVHSDLTRFLTKYPDLTSCGETIGVGPSASAIVSGWEQSPTHDVILRGAWTITGDGLAISSDGRRWAVADFCR